jgi:hypothetical protein
LTHRDAAQSETIAAADAPVIPGNLGSDDHSKDASAKDSGIGCSSFSRTNERWLIQRCSTNKATLLIIKQGSKLGATIKIWIITE